MARMPLMPNKDRIRKAKTVQFKGMNRNKSSSDGDIYSLTNMTLDDLPVLSARKKRHCVIDTVSEPHGMISHDKLYFVSGTKLKCMDGNAVTDIMTVGNNDKAMTAMGAYLLIWPDKMFYNKDTGEYGSLEAAYTGTASIDNGFYAGEAAELNTITFRSAGAASAFKVGDGVKIQYGDTEISAIVREIPSSDTALVFYENTFPVAVSSTTVTVTRSVPELDFVCTNENRVWGCKGDRIYASKLGDPFNWEAFDGISTDSWQVDVGSAGDFTACISYRGYPTFFKEEHIYKVYGSKPANYQVMASASLGVKEGASKSLAVAGEVLFYLSRAGVVAYSGGIPQRVSEALGDTTFENPVAGSDGKKYYLSAKETNNYFGWVYDTDKNMWTSESVDALNSTAWHDGLYMLTESDGLWVIGGESVPSSAVLERDISSGIVFGDFYENDPNKKGVSKLQIRMELAAGASGYVYIMYDSSGLWEVVKEVANSAQTTGKRSFYLPLIPRRCDHFKISITMTGEWSLYSLVRESYSGSEL